MDKYIIRTTRLAEDREIERALTIINQAIKRGSLVYLYELDNRNYSIKLKASIGISIADFSEVE